MAQKQNKKNNDKKGGGGGEDDQEQKTKTTPPTTVVLKVDMHCDGCASKIVKCIRGFKGVESLKVDDETGKLTITGVVDPLKLRDKLSKKMKKQVDLISPLPKKENKPQNNINNKPKSEDKKPKEPPVTSVVLKVQLHCQGCIERIRKTLLKTKGVHDVAIDREKDTVTVKGTMDVKSLTGKLTEKLKRKVEVVPPKKEKEKEKEKEKKENNEDGKKKKQKGDGDAGGENKKGEDGGDGKGKMDQNNMEVWTGGYGYGYGYGDGYGYGYGYGYAPQMFSDENPNACSLM